MKRRERMWFGYASVGLERLRVLELRDTGVTALDGGSTMQSRRRESLLLEPRRWDARRPRSAAAD